MLVISMCGVLGLRFSFWHLLFNPFLVRQTYVICGILSCSCASSLELWLLGRQNLTDLLGSVVGRLAPAHVFCF